MLQFFAKESINCKSSLNDFFSFHKKKDIFSVWLLWNGFYTALATYVKYQFPDLTTLYSWLSCVTLVRESSQQGCVNCQRKTFSQKLLTNVGYICGAFHHLFSLFHFFFFLKEENFKLLQLDALLTNNKITKMRTIVQT